MTQGSSSVVVVARDWEGSVDELARKMMPITRRSPAQVVPLLTRGPMTIEADLSVAEAERLRARLRALGVPAQIVEPGEKPDTPAQMTRKKRTRTALGRPMETGEEPGPSGEIKDPEKAERNTGHPSKNKRRSSTAYGLPSGVASTQAHTRDEDDLDGWGQVFSDISDLSELAEESEQTDHEEPTTIEGLPDATGSVEPDGPDHHDRRPQPIGAFGAEPAPPDVKLEGAAKDAVSSATEGTPSEPPPASWDALQTSDPTRSRVDDTATSAPKLNISPGFDATHMSNALRGDQEDQPPYAPDGFDDRVEHIPALAALLSGLAPGAGQIYNGEDGRVRELCVQAVRVRPWWESIGQARAHAEKIRDYWEPRPKDGALGRALKHLAICWAVAAVLLVGLGWVGSAIYRVVTSEPVSTIPEVHPAKVVQRAKSRVTGARVGAQQDAQAQAAADAKRQREKRFTMPDNERAERLFLQGYALCKNGKYRTCASAMKRVSALSPELRRKAFRLQAWAGIRQSGDSQEPMPDVGQVETLSEYESKTVASDPE